MTRLTRKNTPHHSKHRTTMKNKDDAGKAIAAGGFGCVFRPPIAPVSASHKEKIRQQPYISKLMRSYLADDEMQEVNKIVPIVEKIPNSKRYFLVEGIFVSNNEPLTSQDKINFDSKCNNLIRMGITASNVNSNLHRLTSMYIPDGGISINDAMKNLASGIQSGRSATLKTFGRLNYAMIDTLKHAIVPMNKLGLIHLDLKGDNMLVDSNFEKGKNMVDVRVIDWGLAGIIPNDNSDPIDAAIDRPLQFNTPPSAILFNNNTQDAIERYLRTVYSNDKMVFTSAACKNIAAFVIRNSQQRVGVGHSRYIAQEMKNLTRPLYQYSELEGWDVSSECFSNDSMVQAFTVNYVAAILESYLKPGKNGGLTSKFDSKAYFQEVYRYNVDIWGFLTAYQDLINKVATRSYTSYRNSVVCQLLSDIIFKYCYSTEYAAKKIPVDQLEHDLEKVSFAAGVRSAPVRKVAAAKKVKKKIVLRVASQPKVSPKSVVTLPLGKKRCPTGYTKDPTDSRKCRKKGTRKVVKSKPKAKAKKKPKTKKVNKTRKTPTKNPAEYITFKEGGKSYIQLRDRKRRRCPKGYSKVKIDNGYLICEKK